MMAPETVVTIDNNQAGNKAAEPDQPLSWLRLNIDYFKTVPGILKLVELVSPYFFLRIVNPLKFIILLSVMRLTITSVFLMNTYVFIYPLSSISIVYFAHISLIPK